MANYCVLPKASFPQESGEYKVVQLDIDGQPRLRFQDRGKFILTHAGILKDLAETLHRQYPTMKIDRGLLGRSHIAYVPALESDWYKVHGMGYSEVDVAQKKVLLFGSSKDYNLCISPDHLDLVRPLTPDWIFELE